jgi:hypothetical protein
MVCLRDSLRRPRQSHLALVDLPRVPPPLESQVEVPFRLRHNAHFRIQMKNLTGHNSTQCAAAIQFSHHAVQNGPNQIAMLCVSTKNSEVGPQAMALTIIISSDCRSLNEQYACPVFRTFFQ